MFKFSISNAFRRKGIAIFAILGTALGVALMTVLLSISDGMDRQMGATMDKLAGGIAVYPQVAPMGYYVGSNVPMPYSYVADIEGVDNVGIADDGEKAVFPIVIAFIPSDVTDFGDPWGVSLKGVELARYVLLDGPTATGNIIEGRTVEAENEVLLGRTLQSYVTDQPHGQIGGSFTLPVVGGEPLELTVVGIFEMGNMLEDMSIYCGIDTARAAVAGISGDGVNFIGVEVAGSEYLEQVAEDIRALFADTDVPVATMIAADSLGSIEDMMDMFSSFLWIISMVAATAGGISIFIVMLISVVERTKEFGILKASGWSNGNIISSVVVQSVTIGLLGAAVGLAIGYGVGQAVDHYLNAPIAIVTWRLVLIIASFGVVAGLVGGLYPALRAARVSPIESMRAI